MLSSNPFTTKEMRREENHGFHIVDYTSKILIESRKTWSLTKRGKSVVNSYENVPNADLSQFDFDTIIRVYNDDICQTIDNYNCSTFYEPSYVIARAYQDGRFCRI